MNTPAPVAPALVAHADWSIHPAKRALVCAVRHADGSYGVSPPEPVGPVTDLLKRLRDMAGPGGTAFLGVDFPLGLPCAYARNAGIARFMDALPVLGAEDWQNFYTPAQTAREISLHRPFYPHRPGGTQRSHLVEALGLSGADELYRVCDRATDMRAAASPLFWTLGAKQVGKAAVAGWRDLVAPALRQADAVRIWPFDGPLDELLTAPGMVIAETYPGEIYTHLGLGVARANRSKRNPDHRRAEAEVLSDWAARNAVRFDDVLTHDLRAGFGPHPDGEDRFDALVGLCGMLNILRGRRAPHDPPAGEIRNVEGWILGLDPESVRSATSSKIS